MNEEIKIAGMPDFVKVEKNRAALFVDLRFDNIPTIDDLLLALNKIKELGFSNMGDVTYDAGYYGAAEDIRIEFRSYQEKNFIMPQNKNP